MTVDEQSAAQIAFEDAANLLHDLPIQQPAEAPPLDWRSPRRPPTEPKVSVAAPAYTLMQTLLDQPHRGLVARPLSAMPTLVEAQMQLRSKAVSAQALLEEALAAAEADTHGAIVASDPERARREAADRDADLAAGRIRGPLHGIPLTVKDIIDVSGLPTAAGSSIYLERPLDDAPAVALLREAGAVIFGKAATHEFALGVTTPQCTNPYDPTRIAGGSSGGSAISVATGIGLGSLGTDTRASLRVPAAFCGVVGFKPTFARVPTTGIVPLSWTLDHLGPIAATVADAAVMLDVLIPGSAVSTGGRPAEGLVVGVAASVCAEADPEVAAAVEASLIGLERIGCRLVTVDVPDPDDLAIANAVGLLISRSEAATFHRSRGRDLSMCLREVREQLEAGMQVTAVDYLDAQRARARLSTRAMTVFDRCDLVVTPTTPVVAPRRADYERFLMRLSRNTLVWGLIGTPALSMPCGFTPEGLPVGLQLAARPFAEDTLASVGMELEQELARGW